ncbi:MAG: response regulator [Thiotrichales bacterium]|nr:MAG: response regulator [Thiotrichales bacterium]
MKMNELQRILYIEDEADIRAVALLALEVVGGFTVKACASGQEALAEAEAFAPDLILSDVMMPEMDGPTTIKALRSLSSLTQTPVIFMTAKVQTDEIEHFKSLGVKDVIAKPFDPMTLADQIRRIWAS